MKEGVHDIGNVRVRKVDDRYVVMCQCGWESRPYRLAAHATTEWQKHRDSV